MNSFYNSLKYMVYITQIGLDFIIPVILCVYFRKFLSDTFNLGSFITVIFVLLGFIFGGYNAINRLIRVFSGNNNEKEDWWALCRK